jgi:hypothetical protein
MRMHDYASPRLPRTSLSDPDRVLGEHYNLAIRPLIQAGPHLPATPIRLAFLLALLGYGTKVGLFPVHTWLPDAYSEAPTPVSALLSGSLLAASYPALTPRLGAAFWYERVIHDRFGVVPDGHPRLAPLIRPGTPEDYALPPGTWPATASSRSRTARSGPG